MESFKEALRQKAGFEPVQENMTSNQIRLVGRVAINKVGQWLLIMERLLLKAQNAPWHLDLSKQYFLRGNRILYGWRVILQADNVAQYADELAQTVLATPVVQRQLEEVSLHGNTDRSVLRGGKGAQPLFTAVVGPALKGRAS
jgi:hypothetical protein